MTKISVFAKTATLQGLGLDNSRLKVESVLGPPEEVGDLGAGLALAAYEQRRLQFTYQCNVVVLIAYRVATARSFRVGQLEIVDDVPDAARDNAEHYLNWIGDGAQLQKVDDTTEWVQCPNRVTAVFEAGRLSSLQLS